MAAKGLRLADYEALGQLIMLDRPLFVEVDAASKAILRCWLKPGTNAETSVTASVAKGVAQRLSAEKCIALVDEVETGAPKGTTSYRYKVTLEGTRTYSERSDWVRQKLGQMGELVMPKPQRATPQSEVTRLRANFLRLDAQLRVLHQLPWAKQAETQALISSLADTVARIAALCEAMH